MKPAALGIAILLCLGMAAPALAQAKRGDRFVTGDMLYSQCPSNEPSARQVAQSFCLGYIAAVVDTLNGYVSATGYDEVICVPATVTLDQVRDVAMKYIREHPSERSVGASALVAAGLTKAFPCKQ